MLKTYSTILANQKLLQRIEAVLTFGQYLFLLPCVFIFDCVTFCCSCVEFNFSCGVLHVWWINKMHKNRNVSDHTHNNAKPKSIDLKKQQKCFGHVGCAFSLPVFSAASLQRWPKKRTAKITNFSPIHNWPLIMTELYNQ